MFHLRLGWRVAVRTKIELVLRVFFFFFFAVSFVDSCPRLRPLKSVMLELVSELL